MINFFLNIFKDNNDYVITYDLNFKYSREYKKKYKIYKDYNNVVYIKDNNYVRELKPDDKDVIWLTCSPSKYFNNYDEETKQVMNYINDLLKD